MMLEKEVEIEMTEFKILSFHNICAWHFQHGEV